MREAERELTVVCEEQEAGRVGIEPPDREEAVAGKPLITDRVEDGGTRGFVLGGRDTRTDPPEISSSAARLLATPDRAR